MIQYRRLLATVVLAVGASPALSDEPYFAGLGDIPGGPFWNWSTAISADGSTVIGYSRYGWPQGEIEAYRWTASDGMVTLGFLAPTDYTSVPRGISTDGATIVGGSGPDGGAFRWTEQTGMEPLIDPPSGSYPPEYSDDLAFAVTATNDIIYRWIQGSGQVSIGAPPGSWYTVTPQGISGDGQTIIAGAYDYRDNWHGFYWTERLSWQEIDSLFPHGMAEGVSADGRYLVGWNGGQAFRHDVLLDETTWFGGNWESGIDVSLDGRTILVYKVGDAHLWTDPSQGGDGLRSLKSILADDHGLNVSGWGLSWPVAISDDGRTMTGYGSNPYGDVEAWVAHLGSPTLHVIGDCPGYLRFTVEYVSPDGRVAYLYASSEGRLEIPPGNPCSGTVLGLDGTVQLGDIVRARSNGVAALEARVPPRACGQTFVQVIDLESCLTSNVELIE